MIRWRAEPPPRGQNRYAVLPLSGVPVAHWTRGSIERGRCGGDCVKRIETQVATW
jgi:hypothetical protein